MKIFILFFTLLATWAAPAPVDLEAKALVLDLINRAPTETKIVYGTLKHRTDDDSRREIPVKLSVFPGSTNWREVYESMPLKDFPSFKLTVIKAVDQPNQYLFWRSDRVDEILDLKPEEAFIPFAGTDFWLADFGLQFLHWPSPRILRKEMRKGRPCKVISHINPGEKGYAKVLSWMDNEYGSPLRAEAYDKAGKLVKVFSIGGFKRVEGRWELKEMEIRDDQKDSKTILAFNLEVDP